MTPRILYLHGFASGPSSTKARFFAERFRQRGLSIEIPDLAQGDFEHLTVSAQLRVIESLHSQGPARIHLMGSSMGGYLAALYASTHPEVEKLMLMAPAFSFAQRWPESMGHTRFEAWRSSGYLTVPHYAEGRDRRVSFNLITDALQFPAYPDAQQPALIFHGVHDDVVPLAFSQTFSAAHPNARLRPMPSGHELTNVMQEMWSETEPFFLGA